MERAKAIKELTLHLVHWKRLKHEHIVPTDECENTINALRMAIEVLSVKDCHGCTHYDLLQTPLICHDCSRYYKDRYKDEKGTLDDMFTESAEAYKAWTGEEMGRPHGEWKCMADCGVTECDQCGWSIEEYVGDYNYCPNCGAKMGGDTE